MVAVTVGAVSQSTTPSKRWPKLSMFHARTIRRWIANGDLIVHRVDGVVRIAESDLRTFLALHREG